jgi:cytoskeletal protein RodZ
MRYASRAILAGALGFAAAFVVACGGGSGLLSSGDASNLNNQLDSVSSALHSKNCGDVSSATSQLADAVVNLPGSLNSTLRNNLTQGVSRIAQLARRQCANVQPPPTTQTNTTTTTETTTTQTQTNTTPTTPTNTNTTPTTPTNTNTTPATTPTTPGTTTGTGGAGVGQGDGNSSGGSGTGGNGNSQ